MDKMDRLLSQLPSESPSPELAGRICHVIRLRRVRYTRMRLFLSTVLAFSGTWLLLPSLPGWLRSLQLPSGGLPVVLDWLGAFQRGADALLAKAVSGFASAQTTFTMLDAPAWPGLAALALSVLLVLEYLMPIRKVD